MKIKTRYAKAFYHRYHDHDDGTITRENGYFPVYGNRLTDAGCRNKCPDGCMYDGMEIVTEVYEVDESVVRQYGTLISNDEEAHESE